MIEQRYIDFFNETVAKIKKVININVPILIADHSEIKGHKKALGIAYAEEINKKKVVYQITIDDYFVEEQYKLENGEMFWNITGRNLIEVICHEIAHTEIWRHGSRHELLTKELVEKVLKSA